MSLLHLVTKGSVLFGASLGGLFVGLPLVPVAIAAPVAQLPNQQYPNQQYPNQQYPNQQYPNQQYPNQQQLPSTTILIPGTGASVQLSQIRVASTPPVPQNPCPGIYYEVPFNQYVVVPQQCRPNLVTQQLDQMGMLQMIRATGNVNMPGGTGGATTPYTAPNQVY